MPDGTLGGAQPINADVAAEGGCSFVIDHRETSRRDTIFCAAPRQPGSSYCQLHHARCRLPGGSAAEKLQLREIEVLAAAVGGRRGRLTGQPPPRVLRRLDLIVRAALRLDRSRIVPEGQNDHTPRS